MGGQGEGEGGEEGDGSTSRESERDDDDGGSAPESAGAADDPARDTSEEPFTPPVHPVRQPVAHAEGPAEPVMEILPLGSGLVLVGLGLGLAFLGLRLRRG